MTVSGFCATKSGVAAMKTGIGSTPEKSIRSVPMPSDDRDDVIGLDIDHGVDGLGGESCDHVVHVHADFLVVTLLQTVLRHDRVDEDIADR